MNCEAIYNQTEFDIIETILIKINCKRAYAIIII